MKKSSSVSSIASLVDEEKPVITDSEIKQHSIDPSFTPGETHEFMNEKPHQPSVITLNLNENSATSNLSQLIGRLDDHSLESRPPVELFKTDVDDLSASADDHTKRTFGEQASAEQTAGDCSL